MVLSEVAKNASRSNALHNVIPISSVTFLLDERLLGRRLVLLKTSQFQRVRCGLYFHRILEWIITFKILDPWRRTYLRRNVSQQRDVSHYIKSWATGYIFGDFHVYVTSSWQRNHNKMHLTQLLLDPERQHTQITAMYSHARGNERHNSPLSLSWHQKMPSWTCQNVHQRSSKGVSTAMLLH